MTEPFEYQRTIFIITGGPGTGKSGIAKKFLNFLGDDDIAKVSYDDFKEKEWDVFGFENENEKKRVNEFALEEFYLTIRKLMWRNKTILIEYPFYQYHKQKLLELITEYHYNAVTLYLYTDLRTAYERGMTRDNGGERHPGHLVNKYHIENFKKEDLNGSDRKILSFEEFSKGIQGRDYNIALGRTVRTDVTDFSKVPLEDVFRDLLAK